MNQPTNYIEKQLHESDFSKLRSLMLKQVQSMSGHVWTDYNLHDPGVTIIEQLCYALTDINYRSDYSIEDLLANSEDRIDLHQQGLFTPDESLPVRPLTTIDMQKSLIDQIDEIAYLSLEPASLTEKADHSTHCNILYDAYVETTNQQFLPAESLQTHSLGEIEQKIRKSFCRERNLGSDINAIYFIEDEALELVATIEIDEASQANNVLAEIYFNSQLFLSASLSKSGLTNTGDESLLADLLTGPFLQNGFINDNELLHRKKDISLSSLVLKLKNINGINKIKSIVFQLQNGDTIEDYISSNKLKSFSLLIPEKQDSINVRLFKNGEMLKVGFGEFIAAYEMLVHNRFHHLQLQKIKRQSAQYQHKYKDLSDYTSIQTQFPNAYGINRYGIPASFSSARKARAMQLKGYLMLFDQLMSDHLSMLDNIKDLFSIKLEANNSYKTQPLNCESIPDVEKLYREIPDHEFLSGNKHYEDYYDRKTRVIDFLLALNGRDKEQYGLEYENPYFNSTELEQRLIGHKTENLKQIHTLSSNRAGGYDYSEKFWNTQNRSFIEQYLSNLIGVSTVCRSLIQPLKDQGLKRLDEENKTDIYFTGQSHEPPSDASPEIYYRGVNNQPVDQNQQAFEQVPWIQIADEKNSQVFNTIKHRLTDPDIEVEQLLFNAINLASYRIWSDKEQVRFDLYLDTASLTDQNRQWKYLASFTLKEEAFIAANSIRNRMIELNLEMEGMHLVDHCLLLPVDKFGRKSIDKKEDAGFYAFQITVLLPDWTARFRDSDFRVYFENAFRAECPAHIYPRIHWLSYSSMEKFEDLFKKWLSCKANNTDVEKLNRLSTDLSTYIQAINMNVMNQ